MQCTAKAKSTGERCERDAIEGAEVCWVHGGAAKQVQEKADERIREELLRLMPKAIKEIGRILDDEEASDSNKLRAIQDLLDRVGPIQKQRQELTGEGGGPVEKKVTEEDAKELEEYADVFEDE